MKKILSIILTISMLCCFAACSSGTSTTDNGNDAETSGSTSYSHLGVACELTSEEYGIGFRKGSDLVEEVDSIMDELIADGTLDELASKYELVLVKDGESNNNFEIALSDVEEIKNNGVLKIGITDYEPMNYKDSDGNWTGFDTEFAQAVCEKLGVDAEFIEIDWDNKFVALESKAIDCIWNGMTISDEVIKNTSCSKAYVKNAQVVVMDKDNLNEYKTIDDMKDLTFAAESGSAGVAAANDSGLTNLIEVNTQTDALLEVASGSSDACIIDLTMANSMLK